MVRPGWGDDRSLTTTRRRAACSSPARRAGGDRPRPARKRRRAPDGLRQGELSLPWRPTRAARPLSAVDAPGTRREDRDAPSHPRAGRASPSLARQRPATAIDRLRARAPLATHRRGVRRVGADELIAISAGATVHLSPKAGATTQSPGSCDSLQSGVSARRVPSEPDCGKSGRSGKRSEPDLPAGYSDTDLDRWAADEEETW